MKEKFVGIIKTIINKLLYGKRIIFDGIPEFDVTAKITLKNGSKMYIGNHFKMRSNTYIAAVNGSEFKIGNHVYINRNCNMICRKSIIIGDHCSFGPNVIIYDHDHCFNHEGIIEGYRMDSVVIEPNCWIGAGTIILRGTHIGKGSVIGAGSVIKGIIPEHSLVISKNSRDMNVTQIKDIITRRIT